MSDDQRFSSKVLSALTWRYIGAATQGALQFGIGVALARLLTPEDYGIIGLALIATGLGRLVGDFGFGAAIIQYPGLTEKHVCAALTGTTIMCALLVAIVWYFAAPIASLLGNDELIPILRGVAISLMFSGTSMTVIALLRRELRFRILTIIETSSYVIGFGVVGISMAVSGYGAWSLVIAHVVQSLCLLILSLYCVQQAIWPHFRLQEYRTLIRVASAEVLNNIINYSAENLPTIAVGRWLGTAALGLYNRSLHLMDLPVRYFTYALSGVMFPVFARLQEDRTRLASAFLQTVRLTSLVTVPTFLAMAAAPQTIIVGLFGEQWRGGASAFQTLCLCGPFMAMMRVFGAVSHARGYVFNECGRQSLYMALVAVLVWGLLPQGVTGVAWAVNIAVISRYFLLAQLSLQLTSVRWAQFISVQMTGLVLGVVLALPVHVVAMLSQRIIHSPALQLCLVIATAVLTLLIASVLFKRRWLSEFRPIILDVFRSLFPSRV